MQVLFIDLDRQGSNCLNPKTLSPKPAILHNLSWQWAHCHGHLQMRFLDVRPGYESSGGGGGGEGEVGK